MKVQVEVPVANADGKTVKLTHDRATGKVQLEAPAMFRRPEVRLTDLARAVLELQVSEPARTGSGVGEMNGQAAEGVIG